MWPVLIGFINTSWTKPVLFSPPDKTGTISSTKYLYKAIDTINQLSTGSAGTTYASDADGSISSVTATAAAVNHLFNCFDAGYYKDVTAGSENHLDGGGADDASGTGGSIACTLCPKDSYCPIGTETPVSCETVGTGYMTDDTGAALLSIDADSVARQ